MLLGVISDTHDNLPMVERAAILFAEQGVDAILHAGDFVAPFALKALLQSGLPVTGVFGNNDGERAGLARLCEGLHESPYRLDLGGRAVVLAHAPEDLVGPACDGADVLIHGHTHKLLVEQGSPLVLNPGEAGGWLTGRCTAAVLDLDALSVEIIELGPQSTVKL